MNEVEEKKEAIAGLEALMIELVQERAAIIETARDFDKAAKVRRDGLMKVLDGSLARNVINLDMANERLQMWRAK